MFNNENKFTILFKFCRANCLNGGFDCVGGTLQVTPAQISKSLVSIVCGVKLTGSKRDNSMRL